MLVSPIGSFKFFFLKKKPQVYEMFSSRGTAERVAQGACRVVKENVTNRTGNFDHRKIWRKIILNICTVFFEED